MTHSIVSALRWWGRTTPTSPALVIDDDSADFATLHHWSSRVGRMLSERGVEAGDRVCVLGGNNTNWAAAAYGALKAGAVLQPISPRSVGPELKKIIDDVDASVVIVDAPFSDVAASAVELGAAVEIVPMAEVSALREGAADEFVVDVDPAEPAMVLWTSGTTGRSKGVVFTNQTALNIVFEASLTEAGIHTDSSILLVLPFAFTPGVMWGLFMAHVLGSKLVVQPQFDPAGAVRLLEEHKIEAMFGVPQIFGALSMTPEFATADLSALTTTVTGGAPVPVPLLETWASKGVRLRQIYGMTEAGGVATGTISTDAADHPETCGTGSIFTDVKVMREDGTLAEVNEPGELVVRGPGVTPGYWGDEETTAQALAGGWLHSGDLGVLSGPDGRVKFLDRLKDLIITGGINISPVEIEATISEVDGVDEVAVVRAPDEKFGETPAAIVVGSVEVQTILEHCAAELSDIKVPRYIVIRDSPLPRLPNQKLDKVAIRNEYDGLSDDYERVR